MKKQLGLDDPVYVRFGSYIAKLATGDFGTSFRTREPVTTMIAKRMWPTLQLVFAAMTFAIAIGVPLGFIAALQPGSIVDTHLDGGGGVGPVDGQILARAAADVPVCAEARLAAEFRLWRWRAQISDPAGRDARRLADGAAGADDARRGARDHDRGFRPHRALQGHERDPGREVACDAQCRSCSSSPRSACNSAR